MSLRELQEAWVESLLGPAAPEPLREFRAMVQSKRRRLLERMCPRTFPSVPDDVVSEFLATDASDDPDLEAEARRFLEFAAERVSSPLRDRLRYELLRRSPGPRARIEVFAVDLRYLERGRVLSTPPRRWLLVRGGPPIPLGWVRGPWGGGG